jgi:hypothetical protein
MVRQRDAQLAAAVRGGSLVGLGVPLRFIRLCSTVPVKMTARGERTSRLLPS